MIKKKIVSVKVAPRRFGVTLRKVVVAETLGNTFFYNVFIICFLPTVYLLFPVRSPTKYENSLQLST